ncbi:MAG: zinc-ribbon domain-containing protein [Moritella sp.]|nr:zinc-ribbon domain-containing protein [Moritella sp.]
MLKNEFCPDCNAALEKLQACGATNYILTFYFFF